MSWNVLTLPLIFFKLSFLDIGFLVDSFFFSTLTMLPHCPLVSIVSDEKFAVNLFIIPLYVMSHFFLTALKTFSLSSPFSI